MLNLARHTIKIKTIEKNRLFWPDANAKHTVKEALVC